MFHSQGEVMQRESPGRAISDAVKTLLRTRSFGQSMTWADGSTERVYRRCNSAADQPHPAHQLRGAARQNPPPTPHRPGQQRTLRVRIGLPAPAYPARRPAPSRSPTWVRVSAAAATAPHTKAVAKNTSSTRCSQGRAMAPSPPGSAAVGANRPSPASSGATHERGDVTSGRWIYSQRPAPPQSGRYSE